jgi:hypothetical protein
MQILRTRRHLLAGAAMAGAAGIVGLPESLHTETGMIKSSPQQIIADGTDWRFLDELKRELKT